MNKSKIIDRMLFGRNNGLSMPGRTIEFNFPPKEESDIHRSILCAGDDGLILYFLKRIEKLEEKIQKLEGISPSITLRSTKR